MNIADQYDGDSREPVGDRRSGMLWSATTWRRVIFDRNCVANLSVSYAKFVFL